MLWLAIGEGALMSTLWVAFLVLSGRLRNQPLRRYYPFFATGFIVLTMILISWTLDSLGIHGRHQRGPFARIVLGIFLVTAAITVVILNLRERPTSGMGGSS